MRLGGTPELKDIRKAVGKTLDPAWVKKHGDAAWAAALALIGETAPKPPAK
jgi:hypothetical protein